MSDEKSNVIPLIRDGKTRKIVKDQFDRPPAGRPGGLLDPTATKQAALQEKLARINQNMSDLKDMVRKQNEYLADTGNELAGSKAVVQREEDKSESNTLDTEALQAEYQRKKDAAKKYQEENNRKVTREYGLLGRHTSTGRKPGDSRGDKDPKR